jgi:protein O-GlcNAc transferase
LNTQKAHASLELKFDHTARMKKRTSSTVLVASALKQKAAGNSAQAENLLRKALSRSPDSEEALFSLSTLLFQSGRYDESSQYLTRLVAIRPDDLYFACNLGEAYRRGAQLMRAASLFQELTARSPGFAEAHQNLGITLMDMEAPSDAYPPLLRAVQLEPDNALFLVSLAWSCLKLDRIDEALSLSRRAVELAPEFAVAHRQLAAALIEHGESPSAQRSLRKALELDPGDYQTHSSLIIAGLSDPGWSARDHLNEARAWATQHATPLSQQRRSFENQKDPERRLRVGYVSADFRSHPVQQFLLPLLKHHDRGRFDVFLYSSVTQFDAMTTEYEDWAGDRFVDISRMEDAVAAERIASDKIDLLVDLSLHTAWGRLRIFAHRPAPIQLSWLGYMGTTGLDTIDYRITDHHFDPPGSDLGVYSERCIHMPATVWCYDALNTELEVGPLPLLDHGYPTFGCLNGYRKVHEGTLSLWSRLLKEVPNACLSLYAEDHQKAQWLAYFESQGLSSDRLVIAGRMDRREYLSRYASIDVGLDTFPFAGGTTTLDAAWMGVPVVTLTGETAVNRGGECIAQQLKLPELIAKTEDDYLAKAIELAFDAQHLSRLRASLRSRLAESPLGDFPRFAADLEQVYRRVWRYYSE